MNYRTIRSTGKAFAGVGLLFAADMLLMVVWSIISVGIYIAYTAFHMGMRADSEVLLEKLASSPQALFLNCIYNLFAILLAVLFWKYFEKDSPERIGLSWGKGSLKLFAAGIAAAVFEIGLVILMGRFSGILWLEQSGAALYTSGQLRESVFFGVLAFILVGFGEEVVFRGYVLKRLMLSLNKGLALILSAAVFAAAHLLAYSRPLDLVDVALGGVIMGALYIMTDSIYLPAGYHFMTDFLQVNILKLQEYEGYKGAVLLIFRNAGDLKRYGVNWGSTVEVAFIAAELLILLILFLARRRISIWMKCVRS